MHFKGPNSYIWQHRDQAISEATSKPLHAYRSIEQFFCASTAAIGPGLPRCRGFMITLRYTTFGRTVLDDWSATKRPLPNNTRDSQERENIHAQRDSNPQSQQLSGRIDSAASEIRTSDNKSIKCFTPEKNQMQIFLVYITLSLQRCQLL